MQINELIQNLDPQRVLGPTHGHIARVIYDSRQVRPGDLFVAIPGARSDGAWFIESAIERGAVAVVLEHGASIAVQGATMITVPNARRALAQLSARIWGEPSQRIGLVGVTGTDGKTTTATLIAELFEAAGLGGGLWSTIEIRAGGRRPNAEHRTTPEAPELQEHLASVLDAGLRWGVVEVSSHALAQERTTGCEFDVAVFTNLAPEHLDFHGSFAAYRATKARLFQSLQPGSGVHGARAGVINADDPNAAYFAAACRAELRTYGLADSSQFRAGEIRLGMAATSFRVDTPFGSRVLESRLLGRCNVYNWLAAIATSMPQGVDWRAIQAAAERVNPVPGRLQQVSVGQPFTVLVDFAHTPQALAAVLRDCRSLTHRRVIVVLGHPGERYMANRPRLGAVAVRGANLAIITSDDSYGEEPASIIQSIAWGARRAGGVEQRDFLIIPERRQAISTAINAARAGDIVLIAGRGNLDQQEMGEQRIPFDDALVAQDCLQVRAAERQDRREERVQGISAAENASR